MMGEFMEDWICGVPQDKEWVCITFRVVFGVDFPGVHAMRVRLNAGDIPCLRNMGLLHMVTHWEEYDKSTKIALLTIAKHCIPELTDRVEYFISWALYHLPIRDALSEVLCSSPEKYRELLLDCQT